MKPPRFLSFFALFLALLLAATAPGLRADSDPPYNGTIFIMPDIIRPTDPTAFLRVEEAGRGPRRMFDRRTNGRVQLEPFLFQAHFDNGQQIEIQVNPEFESAANASVEAAKYAAAVGQLPAALRKDVETVWIHKGRNPFGGGNRNLLIHTGMADFYVTQGILEETLVHEAAHTSLDSTHSNAPGWLNAQGADGRYISTYARDFPRREDVAESYLPYLAIRFRPDRVPPAIRKTIIRTMANRIAYFDTLSLDMHPMPSLELPSEENPSKNSPGTNSMPSPTQ